MWTGWASRTSGLRHNLSQIPDDVLEKTIRELQESHLFRRKFRKLIFWIKLGEFKYAFKRFKETLKVKKDTPHPKGRVGN